jgi:hypothetical protein
MLGKGRSTGLNWGVGVGAALALGSLVAFGQSSMRIQATQSAVSGSSAAPGNVVRARGFLGFRGGPFGGQGVGVVGAPYSAVEVTETITKFPDGNRIVQKTTTRYFRDSEGRVRTEHIPNFPIAYRGPAEQPPQPVERHPMVTINDPVIGETFMLNEYDKTAQQMFSYEAAERIEPPVPVPEPGLQMVTPGVVMGVGGSEQGSKTTPLGDKTIEGVRVTGTRVEHTVPAGRIGNDRPMTASAEQWFSSELGIVVLNIQRSSTGTETTTRMEQIVRSEPDASLFTVPAGYTKRDNPPGITPFKLQKKPEGN